MSKSARPSPSLVPAILALLVLVALGYLLFTDSQPSRTEHTLSPPLEIGEIEDVEDIDTTALTLDQQALLNEEAEMFVENLSVSTEEHPLAVTEQSGAFVRHDGHITLPTTEHRTTTLQDLIDDKTLSDNTLLELSFTETKIETTTLSQLAVNTDDKTISIRIQTEDGQQYEASLAELLNNGAIDVEAPIQLFTTKKRTEQVLKKHLPDIGIPLTQEISVTIHLGSEEFSIKEVIQSASLPDNALFYLHRVTENDRQGLWGIIQSGLIARFREGLILEGLARNKDRVQVAIPADADEPLPTGLSSFLGKILSTKVESSYIYNFNTHTMGHNPDLIFPGQQLIMIQFSADELKTIYMYFANQRREQAESFAISP